MYFFSYFLNFFDSGAHLHYVLKTDVLTKFQMYRGAAFPPHAFPPTYHPGMPRPPYPFPDPRDPRFRGMAPPRQQQQQKEGEGPDGVKRTPIIKAEDLKEMDSLEPSGGGWATEHGEVDYK